MVGSGRWSRGGAGLPLLLALALSSGACGAAGRGSGAGVGAPADGVPGASAIPGGLDEGSATPLPLPSETPTPADTPTPSDTPTPTPSPTPPPEAFWPQLPPIDGAAKERLRAVFAAGQARGLRAGVFMKVGDSITASGAFLTDLGCGRANLAEHEGLRPALEHFAATELPLGASAARCGVGNSFSRRSLASQVGWSAVHVLRPAPSPTATAEGAALGESEAGGAASEPATVDPSTLAVTEAVSVTSAISDTAQAAPTPPGWPPECAPPNDTPLRCELTVIRPAFAVVMFGTNDLEAGVDLASYAHNLRRIGQELLEAGVIPVFSTIPPRPRHRRADARVSGYNQTVKAVADELGLPLWNYWAQLDGPEVLGRGISGDGVHPNVWRYGGDFSATGLRYGYNLRSLGALRALDRLWRVVALDGAPEG